MSVIREGAPNRMDQDYPGIGGWYVPAPGFRGADQFGYNVFNPNSLSHDTVVANVRYA
ncbi:MAG: hypothetical protein ACRYHQ_29380 [Janthinobacterium lividum]